MDLGSSKQVNLHALDSVVRVASSMGDKLEPVANTIVPAVCKNLASSNQQRIALAEEALDALCQAVDPCLMVQPVASLAQYGNARLKVPMLALLRDLTPVVGRAKPILLPKYVRPAALSLVRENHPSVRDAGLSLLRAIEIALDPAFSRTSSNGDNSSSNNNNSNNNSVPGNARKVDGASGGGGGGGGTRRRPYYPRSGSTVSSSDGYGGASGRLSDAGRSR